MDFELWISSSENYIYCAELYETTLKKINAGFRIEVYFKVSE